MLALTLAALLSPGTVRPAAGAVSSTGAGAADRDAAFDSYQVLRAALAVPVEWSGSVQECRAGAPSEATQAATLTALNWFRERVGLVPVVFDAELSAQAQQAALLMDAADGLSHAPPSSWPCWTVEGARAAGASTLHLVPGAAAVVGYVADPGTWNTAVGHRRWLLHPPQRVMGSGSTPGANVLQVFGGWDPAPSGPAWIAWPPAGHLPVQLEPAGRWSLTVGAGTADFSRAAVRVTSAGAELPVRLEPVQPGYGNDTLVFQVDVGHGPGLPDRAYDVEVTGVVVDGLEVSHRWTTTLFDGEVDPRQLQAAAE